MLIFKFAKRRATNKFISKVELHFQLNVIGVAKADINGKRDSKDDSLCYGHQNIFKANHRNVPLFILSSILDWMPF
jgi:hypothetical protein